MNEKLNKIAKILLVMCELYDKQLSKEAIGLYLDILSPYPIEKIEEAGTRILKEKTFNRFPIPAEFIVYIDPPESKELRAITAFGVFERKVETKGIYHSVFFDDPNITTVVNSFGGWIDIINSMRGMTDKDYGYFEKEFHRRYCLFVGNPAKGKPSERLMGVLERDNRAAGYLIGGEVTNYIERNPNSMVEISQEPRSIKRQLEKIETSVKMDYDEGDCS